MYNSTVLMMVLLLEKIVMESDQV